MLTLAEHPLLSGVRVAHSSAFCIVFCRLFFVLLSFFLVAIVLFVLLQFTTSDYPVGIFTFFLILSPTH